MNRKLLSTALLMVCSSGLFAQTTINHTMTFNSGHQYMWGPAGSSFELDMENEFFDIDEDEDEEVEALVYLPGFGDFGVRTEAGVGADVQGEWHMEGFEDGTIRVNYPITTSLIYPNNNSYDQGDWVTIQTDYQVNNGYYIQSNFSNANSSYDLVVPFDFELWANTQVQLGFTSFMYDHLDDNNLLQGESSPINFLNIFGGGSPSFGSTPSPGTKSFFGEITVSHVENNGLYLGDGTFPWPGATPGTPYVESFLSGIVGYPRPIAYDLSTKTALEQNAFGDLGISDLEADLPDVNLGGTNLLGNKDITASGTDTYFRAELDLLALIGMAYPPFGTVADYLNGSFDIESPPPMQGDIANVDWNIFSATLEARRRTYQDFRFSPDVRVRFVFPVAVEYQEIGPGNTVVNSGNSTVIYIEVGNDLRYKFPCYYEEMEIDVRYSINGRMHNHTYDRMPFEVIMEAGEIDVDMPNIVLIPEISFDGCIDIPFPCGTFLDPEICYEELCACDGNDCETVVLVEEVSINMPNFEVGPLWDETIDVSSFTAASDEDWIDDDWWLSGFGSFNRGSFTMEASPVTISATPSDVSCHGANDGSINVVINAVNHANPYTYNWSNGSNVQDPSGLSGGPYELMATDGNGCDLFAGATVYDPSELDAIYTQVDKPCAGGPDLGSIDVTVFGGDPPYSYSWSNGATTEDLSGLAAGNFVLTITDSRNCTKVVSVTITEPNTLGHNATITDANCFGGSDGTIDVTPFGGTLPYAFSWSGGQITEDVSGLNANTYVLTITDGKGCTNIGNHVVGEPVAPLALIASPIEVSCHGGNDGGVDITTSGGTPGYTYEWVSDLGGLLPYITEDISNIPFGTYTVIATDSKGCEAQISQLVDQPTAPLSSEPVIVDVLCFGDATGSIDPVIAGGTAPYNYLWSNGATTSTLPNVVAGAYSLTVTDDRGCTDTYDYTITEPLAPLSLTFSWVDILCNGEPTGSIDVDVEGGTAPYNYLWSNGGTTDEITNLFVGNYSVDITDDHGCTLSDNHTLIEPGAPLDVTSVITDVDCHGNNTGSIDVTITGGTAPYTKLWSNSGTVILMDTTEDISNQYADTYTLLVTDANACTFTLESTINEPSMPLAITGVIDHVNCFGLNDGAIDITVTGGTPTYSFNWSNGATTEDISTVVSGTYDVLVTDQNSCTETMSFFIDQPAAPLNIELFKTDVLCNGGNDGGVESDVSGGTAPYDYNWSNSETTEELINLTAGVYTLTITDDQGCVAFSGTTITEPPLLEVFTTVADASCYEYEDGAITLTISGGVEPYYFNWGNQNEILVNNPSETISGLGAEEYFIRVRDEHGCINEQFVTIGQPAPFVATYVITDPLCYEGNDGNVDVSIVGGTLPYSSLWSDGQTTEDAVNLTAGEYNFSVTDDQGCVLEESLTVNHPNPIEISYQIEEVSCIDQSDASIYVTPYGGVMPYTYLWSTGSTDLNAEGLAPSNYEITIIDDHQCTETFSFEIQMNYEECLIIPNAFTPNGDNYNDTWVIGNIDLYPNATVKIFNKWGNEIFASSGAYSPWEGTHNGNALPSDVYYYIIILNNGESNEYTGTVTIVR